MSNFAGGSPVVLQPGGISLIFRHPAQLPTSTEASDVAEYLHVYLSAQLLLTYKILDRGTDPERMNQGGGGTYQLYTKMTIPLLT